MEIHLSIHGFSQWVIDHLPPTGIPFKIIKKIQKEESNQFVFLYFIYRQLIISNSIFQAGNIFKLLA